jgi:hypothetical protein
MGHEYLFLPESMRLYYSLLSPCMHNLAQNKEIHVRLLIAYIRPHILYNLPFLSTSYTKTRSFNMKQKKTNKEDKKHELK